MTLSQLAIKHARQGQYLPLAERPSQELFLLRAYEARRAARTEPVRCRMETPSSNRLLANLMTGSIAQRLQMKNGWRRRVSICLAVILLACRHPGTARADTCQSNNTLAQCSCQNACQFDDSNCRCADSTDQGIPLACTSLDGKKEVECFMRCERSNNDVRCNDSTKRLAPSKRLK
jgi:hypothetical protein